MSTEKKYNCEIIQDLLPLYQDHALQSFQPSRRRRTSHGMYRLQDDSGKTRQY